MEGAVVGIAHFKDTAKVNKYLNLPQVKAIFPRTLKFAWTVKPLKNTQDYYQLVALKVSTRNGQAPLGGDKVTNARAEFSNNKSNAEVTMTMNGEGAKIWARLTKDNIGKQIAIVLDNYVYSFPVVQSEIRGGRSSITGDFTIEEAKDLANVLKSGKLPAPARIIEESVVGPSLGKEAISASLRSFIIAFVLVLLYMVFYYAKSGLIADIALLSNMIFIVGILASLGAVLTLPGMAGIVLTIGMSVDANVLIFERIREELRAGKGIKLAISDGYKAAYSSILDANITTLLTGIILYVFGTGPIQGFATTLIIGILTSLFSAIFITRLIYSWWLGKNWKINFSIKLTEDILVNSKFPFIEKRKIFYVLSSTLVLISLISILVNGFNLGIDFKGGRTYIIRFPEKVSSVEVAQNLKKVFGELPEVKVFGKDNQLRIATKFMIDNEDKDADLQVEKKLFEGLQPILQKEGKVSFADFETKYKMSSQKVGPTIADDIKVAAMWAILFSLLVIFLYILIRFRNWQYSLGGIVALIHDTIIVLGIFSLFKNVMPFSLEIDQAFIAAILTVVGYSINDTVVIYDRIREYFTLHPKRDKMLLFNQSMNSTLTRTINTSLSTFIVLLIIFLFGGEVIRGFVFAIMVGIVVGTYSSLFIAAPITYETMKYKKKLKK
ncbi:MAG TPA: protein translocase subunit SecD, partial [Bacteroidales bacterium]|nr:protein translocase subunit SecD [Bacteroidales bacterium]